MTPCMAFFRAASSRSWQRCRPSPFRWHSGSTWRSRMRSTGTPVSSSRASPSTVKRKCANATGLPVGGAFFLDLALPGGARSVTSAKRDEASQRSSMSACGFHLCPRGPRLELTSSYAHSSSSSEMDAPVRKCTSSSRPSRSYLVNAPKPDSTSRSWPSSSRSALRSVARWCFSVLRCTFLMRASPLQDRPLDLEPPPLEDLPEPQALMSASLARGAADARL